MSKKISIPVLILCIFALVIFPAFSQVPQDITITTYYPSPFGAYNDLTAHRMAIGDLDGDGNVDVGDIPPPLVGVTRGFLAVENWIGIGIQNPDADFDLVVFDTGNSALIGLQRSAPGDGWVGIGFDGSNQEYYMYMPTNSDNLYWGTDTAGYMRMTPIGRIGIGTPAAPNPSYRLHVVEADAGVAAIWGESTGGGVGSHGVHGVSTNSIGVYGESTSSWGVYGMSNTLDGVMGASTDRYGVYGWSNNSYGVYGRSSNSYGVYGYSPNSFGVRAQSDTSNGLYARSTDSYGVYARSFNSYGVYGFSSNSNGVYGFSSTTSGVYGRSNSQYGVTGNGATVGVYGTGSTYGVWGSGGTYGVRANGTTYGIMASGSSYAGYFIGSVYVSGQIRMGAAGAGIFGKTVYWDVAEGFAVKDAEPGDVLVIDSVENETLTKSTKPYDSRIVGIFSTDPAIYIAAKEGFKPLAMLGRVPVKVSTVNGPVKRGDPLTSSSIPGVAMKATKPGQIVGKALEPYDDPDEVGTIMTFVNVSYFEGDPSAPAYTTFSIESRKKIIERVRKEIPKERLNQAVMFWNEEADTLEVYLPAKGEFRNLQGQLLAKQS